MRIFHGPQNISGMATMLASAQRELGYQAESHCFDSGIFQYKPDKILSMKEDPSTSNTLIRYMASFDVFHFYFGASIDGLDLKDIALLHGYGKKVFMYFCGCDIRDSKHVIATRPFSACHECWPMLCNPNRNRALSLAKTMMNGVFVSTPDLLETLPHATLLPQPIDIEKLSKFYAPDKNFTELGTQKKPLKIAHAPSSQSIKGSKYVFSAVESLRSQGFSVELILIENRPWEEALREYTQAHIAIDQLLIGTYGSLSVELMTLGVPVICYLDERYINDYPKEPPIINANPFNLVDVIKKYIETPSLLYDLIPRGREYTREVHDSKIIAKKALDRYLA